MKTISPIFRIAGILFLLYANLVLINAIIHRTGQAQRFYPSGIQEGVMAVVPAEPVSQPILRNPTEELIRFADPVSETDPESVIEAWMLDPNYLDDEFEPVAPIEAWMLDRNYLNQRH